MKYKWILFDADGTLFDYDRAESTALAAAFEDNGLHFSPGYLGVYRLVNSQIWRDYEQGRITQERLRTRRFELLFAEIGVEADSRVFSERYLLHLSRGTFLVEGARNLVEQLRGRMGLLLITNGLTDVQRPRLANSAIGDAFDLIVISEEEGVAKPDNRIFDICFERMGWPQKREVLMVGDSLTSDIKGGSNYSIDTCWFNPNRQPAPPDLSITYEIQRLEQLAPILDSP